MKKNIYISFIFLIFIFSSCSKVNNLISSTITADLDGTSVKFNDDAAATSTTVSGIHIITISGNQTGSSGASFINIEISSNDPISNGASYTDTSATHHASIEYTENGVDNIDADGITKVTILSVSSSSIQGTFGGSVSGTSTHSFANGAFNVKFE